VGGAPRAGDVWELGILLPERLVKGDLRNVLQELNEWDGHLKALLPLFSEAPVRVALRTYTTERFELAAPLDRDRALALGVIVAGLYALFQEVKVNRRRAEDLEKQGYPSEIVGRVTAYEQQIVSEQLQGLKAKLMQRNLRKGAGKRKEIERRLDAGLRFMAVRVREGVDMELLAPAFIDPVAEATVESGADPVTHHVRVALQAAEEAGRAVAPSETKPDEAEAPRLPLNKIAEGAGEEKKAA
jgi:hypothetical protein